MNPAQIERVFGRGRLKMTTGEHVEVFREAVAPGERRRYTKRFLATSDGDFGQWTEREWRILARLIGHGVRCVPDVVQFDGGAMGGIRLVQTYDAGVTADQWATLLPVSRDGAIRRHVFEDCAHWWALAHHCLTALDEIHSLQLVHLDIKGDNICVPYGPTNFDPDADGRLYPIFPKLALIDFAFSLVSRENLSTPLPIGWQKDYDYQSPRLLRALDAGRSGDLQLTKELDWRCDMYSLAAMLRRYLPSEAPDDDTAWTRERYDDARTLIFRLRECHDRDLPHWRPHQQLIDFTGARVIESDLVASLDHGWTLARDVPTDSTASPVTPLTRIAPSIRPIQPVRTTTPMVVPTAVTAVSRVPRVGAPRRTWWRATVLAPLVGAIAALAAPAFIGDPEQPLIERAREAFEVMRSMLEGGPSDHVVAPSIALPALPRDEPLSPVADATPAPIERPAADAPAPEAAREQPDAKAPLTVPEQKAPSIQVAKARAKSATPANRSPSMPSPSLSVSGVTRPAHPLPRSGLSANSKQSRGPSIASAGAPRPSSTRQSPVQKQPLQASPPEFRVAGSTPVPAPSNANFVAQSASPSTDDARVATSDPAPDQSSSKLTATPQPPVQQGLPRTARNEPQTSTAVASGASGAVERVPNEQRRGLPPATNQEQQRAQNPQPFGELRTLLSNLGHLLQGREGAPAPVEERHILAPTPRVATSGSPAQSPPDLPSQTSPQSSALALSLPGSTEQRRAEVNPSALPAPTLATPPSAIANARAEVATSPVPAVPVPSLPLVAEPAPGAWDQSHAALVARARRVIADDVPRVAAQAQPDVSRVLALAATANHRSQQQAVVDAAYVKWPSESGWLPPTDIEPVRARRLHDEARQALASGRVSDALDIELTAFGANPRDPDIAVYLAFLHLRMNPMQAETARRLALYAIFVSGSQRSIRYGDWDTLAVASALVGRDSDATRAFFVEVALTNNLDRTCQTALSAYAAFGERFRAPVQAMLSRIDSNGRVSPYCEWPTRWNTSMRW
jgi:serine/threonine protein kinase